MQFFTPSRLAKMYHFFKTNWIMRIFCSTNFFRFKTLETFSQYCDIMYRYLWYKIWPVFIDPQLGFFLCILTTPAQYKTQIIFSDVNQFYKAWERNSPSTLYQLKTRHYQLKTCIFIRFVLFNSVLQSRSRWNRNYLFNKCWL